MTRQEAKMTAVKDCHRIQKLYISIMPFKRAITYSLIINLFFLALCLIFGDLKFGAVDDYFMAARLTGALGTEYNPHLIFVNAIYGYVLLPLYHLQSAGIT